VGRHPAGFQGVLKLSGRNGIITIMNDTTPHGEAASGRFRLRVSPGLHGALRGAAAEVGLSLNEYCARKLSAPGAAVAEPGAEVVARAAATFGENLLGVLVFGSWARGDAGEESDVDLLVVVDPAVAISRSLYRGWDETAPELTWDGRRLEVHFVRLPEAGEASTGLWAEAALDGVVLFERGFELSRRLIGIRGRIATGAVRRGRVHGQPYWVGGG